MTRSGRKDRTRFCASDQFAFDVRIFETIARVFPYDRSDGLTKHSATETFLRQRRVYRNQAKGAIENVITGFEVGSSPL